MRVEVPYDQAIVLTERTLGYPLHDPGRAPRIGDSIELGEAHRYTTLSVLTGLERAIASDRAAAETAGQTFDRDRWHPSAATVAEIREQHRPHTHYLRGLAGLKRYRQGLLNDAAAGNTDLYEHQREAFDALITHMDDNDPFAEASAGAFADIAGGGGKSRIIAMVADGFKREEDPNDPNRVLIIAKDIAGIGEIVGEQGKSGIGRYAPHLAEEIVSGLSSADGTIDARTRQFVLFAIQRDPHFLERFDLVLADEGHVLLGEQTRKAVKGARRPMYGFTGSSKYSEDKRLDQILPDRLVKRSARELVVTDILSPVQFWVCKTGEVIYEDSATGDYTKQELERISHLEDRHRIMADAGHAFLADNRNGYFTCGTVAEAIAFAKAHNDTYVTRPDGSRRHIRIKPVFAGQDNGQTFRELQNNEIQAVTIVDIDTGWDVPNISFGVHGRPVKAEVRAKQRSARLYRKCFDADGNLVTAQFFDLLDIVTRRPKRTDSDRPDIQRSSPKQILVPQLFGEQVYRPGQVIAAPTTEGKRRDFSLQQFPPHLRWPLTMGDGLTFSQLIILGTGTARQRSPEGKITLAEAAYGLGVTPTRLNVALAVTGGYVDGGQFLDEKTLNAVGDYFLKHNEPIR